MKLEKNSVLYSLHHFIKQNQNTIVTIARNIVRIYTDRTLFKDVVSTAAVIWS